MTNSIIETLQKILTPDQYSTDPVILEKYSRDASSNPAVLPEIVIFPKNSTQISEIIRYSNNHHIPLTARGCGTSLEGNSIPVKSGIVLDMSKNMNKILKIYEKDLQVSVEPGIIGDVLNTELEKYNLFFPAFPASSHIASIGGMIANNAGGMYAVKYGVVGDWVMQIEAVLANGDIINCGSRSIKSVAGFDLKNLFIGSEGTLGIVTRATLRLTPLLKNKYVYLVSYKSVEQALQATIEVLQANLDPLAVEFIDSQSVKFVNKLKNLNWPESPTLIFEFVKSENDQIKQKTLAEIFNNHQAMSQTLAATQEAIKTIWDARKSVHPAIRQAYPAFGILHGDIGLPISQIPEFMDEVEKQSKQSNLHTASFGHIADGNIHVWILYVKSDDNSKIRAYELNQKLVEIALQLSGTCTAEHGIGIGKRKYLELEHPSSINLMRQIKKLLDQNGILNPGKMFI